MHGKVATAMNKNKATWIKGTGNYVKQLTLTTTAIGVVT